MKTRKPDGSSFQGGEDQGDGLRHRPVVGWSRRDSGGVTDRDAGLHVSRASGRQGSRPEIGPLLTISPATLAISDSLFVNDQITMYTSVQLEHPYSRKQGIIRFKVLFY
jgi:hypothetical protein